MSDSEHILLAELERLAPSDISTEPDWGDVLRRANKHIGRRPRGAAPWKIVVALAVALAVAAPALAFTDGVRSLLGLGSTRPVPSTEQVLVSAPIGNGFYAHLVRSASTTGGRCLIVAADHAPTPALPITGGGGGSMCTVTDKRLNRQQELSARHRILDHAAREARCFCELDSTYRRRKHLSGPARRSGRDPLAHRQSPTRAGARVLPRWNAESLHAALPRLPLLRDRLQLSGSGGGAAQTRKPDPAHAPPRLEGIRTQVPRVGEGSQTMTIRRAARGH